MSHKLTASAISAFLKSPKSYYWAYLHKDSRGVEPPPSMAYYSHDLVFGQVWGEFVGEFYSKTFGVYTDYESRFVKRTAGWMDSKTQGRYLHCLSGLYDSYCQQFNPDDGARTPDSSERRIENDLFYGYLDGMSADGIIHECKTAKRSPSLDEQLWQEQNSIQAKLYAVLTQAKGIRIEFAFKDAPYVVYRAPVRIITPDERQRWQAELESLSNAIHSMTLYPCNTKSCTLITKGTASPCKYKMLCEGDEAAEHFYKLRDEERR